MRGYKKYRNIKYKGFDSIREAQRYSKLKMLEDAGEISDLRTQVTYELIPKQTVIEKRISEKTGKELKPREKTLEHACTYIADFVYVKDGETIVEDTKGFRTDAYKIKKKLMLYRHGIRIKEI